MMGIEKRSNRDMGFVFPLNFRLVKMWKFLTTCDPFDLMLFHLCISIYMLYIYICTKKITHIYLIVIPLVDLILEGMHSRKQKNLLHI